MSPRAKRLADILRAEAVGKDLQDDGHRLVVCAMREDGSLYELGFVSEAAIMQDPSGARAAVERIKFSA